MDIDTLKKRRGRLKAAITRIETFININVNKIIDVNEFIVREGQLVKNYDKYLEIQESIEDTDDEGAEHDRVVVEQQFFAVAASLRSIISKLSAATTDNITNTRLASAPHQTSDSGVTFPLVPHAVAQVKLPHLNIPTFAGRFEEYFSFTDLFSAVVNNNDTLSDVQKLIYLKSVLRGEPLDIVNSLSITKENYIVALELLKGRYDKKFPIINAHLKGLLDVPQMHKGNATAMRQFITQVMTQVIGI